jgi:hypothetical protein
MRHAGLIQAGPRLDSGVVASQVTVTLVSRELVRAVVAAPKSEMHKLSTANQKRDRNAYLCKLSRGIWVTEKSCALLSWAHALSAATPAMLPAWPQSGDLVPLGCIAPGVTGYHCTPLSIDR